MDLAGEGQTAATVEIGLPVRVRDGDSWSAQFLVPAAAAQALVEPDELEAIRMLPGRTAAILSFARYRDSDLGSYEEVAIAFLVRRRDPRRQSVVSRRTPRTGLTFAAEGAVRVRAG